MKNFKIEQTLEKKISAAFDSVNLINELAVGELTENKKSAIERNVKHLELMLTKEDFSGELTTEQRQQINSSIESGNSFINTSGQDPKPKQ